MKLAFRILTVAAGILYEQMAVKFFFQGPVVLGVLALVVSAWYFFGYSIAKRVR